LGKFAPGYSRGVFANGNSPTLDPVQVGLGLGITQGLVGGAIIGLLIVFAPGRSLKGFQNFFTDAGA